MKREHLLWLAATTAGAAPLLEYGQGAKFDLPGLRFGIDRQFKITVFEDLHFGEESWWQGCPKCPGYDAKTTKVMEDILGWEPTDLAVLNGDLLSGEAVKADNYTEYIDHIVQPLVQRKIPWASTYGNHDRNVGSSSQGLLEKELSYNKKGRKLAWTQSMLPGDETKVGTSNYYIPIYSGGANPKLVLLLWFFDSRAGVAFQQPEVSLEDFVAPEVVSWYKAQNSQIKKAYGRVIPSLAFVHIPFRASYDLQQLRKGKTNTSPGINGEIIGHQANTCDSNGDCEYNGKDLPFMKALAETDGLMAVFSGHDHNVDWCMKWAKDKSLASVKLSKDHGLNVCFGRRTGYGGYNKSYSKGARKIAIHEDDLDKKEVETWIRLEDGSISGAVVLNSTYGTDEYPAKKPAEQSGETAGAS